MIYIHIYCEATIFIELLKLAKLEMTHETLNLLALNVRSKVTHCTAVRVSKSQDAVVLFIKTLN